MVVLVTGGSGFIGWSLVKYLLRSFEVKVLDLKQPREKITENIEYAFSDIRSYECVKNA